MTAHGEPQTLEPPPHEPPEPHAIDTSGMSAAKREIIELAEASRDTAVPHPSFAGALFMGRCPWSLIHPYPRQPEADRAEGRRFLTRLDAFLRERVDADEIDRTGEIPQEVIDGLAGLGAFGIKIGREYGGLGLSQTNYSRAAILLGSWCGNTTALLSAHQSIGVPQPLLIFGTEEQKERFLPRFARGQISAFALTERGVGSDPARMSTRADPTPDGRHFLLNGEKLWCTNGTRADVIVVMARTPPKMVHGRARSQITAFIVETDSPGVTVVRRCRFMGLHALYNGVIRFENVKVPRENILLAEGKGLKVALTTLNTGRLTLPAACVGLVKRCLGISRRWACEREQWGAPIGRHAAIADKIAAMASKLFAMESMTLLTSALVDRGDSDIRIEAAMAKMFASEAAWEIVNETMQIRGGRGYETAESLRARGEDPVPVERFLRDCRINMIFEGSSEILRLFIAREALDPHLKAAGAVFNTRLPVRERILAALRAAAFYALWYPLQWLPLPARGTAGLAGPLRRHARYATRASRRLARTLFHALLRHGPKLEREQMLLRRFVDAGTEIFAIAASCARAAALIRAGRDPAEILPLIDHFCRESRARIERAFHGTRRNNDARGYRLAQAILDGRHASVEEGIVQPIAKSDRP